MNLSRREVHSAAMDHADSYILRCPVARSEFFVVYSTFCFCFNTEHSQYRVSAVDVSPDFFRPEDDWKQESGKERKQRPYSLTRHGSNIRLTEITQNSRDSRCSKYEFISPPLKQTLNYECLKSA
jgi:hypothetical protein